MLPARGKGGRAGHGAVGRLRHRAGLVGSSIRAAKLSQILFEGGINVQPIIYPAVPEQGARLRFFLSSLHEEAALRRTAAAVADGMRQVANEKLDLGKLAASLRD